jgi:hypothetical protein
MRGLVGVTSIETSGVEFPFGTKLALPPAHPNAKLNTSAPHMMRSDLKGNFFMVVLPLSFVYL